MKAGLELGGFGYGEVNYDGGGGGGVGDGEGVEARRHGEEGSRNEGVGDFIVVIVIEDFDHLVGAGLRFLGGFWPLLQGHVA